MMATHIANLAFIVLGKNPPPPDPEYQPVVHAVISNLDQAIHAVKTVKERSFSPAGVEENLSEKISDAEPGNSIDVTGRNRDHLISSDIDTGKSEAEGSFAREGLRLLNDRVAEMIRVRKKELEQGIRESKLRNNLALVKSVNDQFNFIWKISEDLLKTLRA